jgi:polyisoprenoid-binding protein YceI
MKNKAIFVSLFALVLSVSASAETFHIDPAHSNVQFTIKHLFSKVSGSFTDFKGDFNYTEGKVTDLSKINFEIKAASINTQNAKRDEHLRSADFFDVTKFENINFVSKSAKPNGKDTFALEGDLTIHGVTKPVSFSAEFLGSGKNPQGGLSAGFTAKGKINRKDFGIVWNKSLDNGSFVLGDDVEISINIEAHKVDGKSNDKSTAKKK